MEYSVTFALAIDVTNEMRWVSSTKITRSRMCWFCRMKNIPELGIVGIFQLSPMTWLPIELHKLLNGRLLESASSVCSPSSISIDDDLTPSEPSITLASTDKWTARINVDYCVLIQIFSRNDIMNHLLKNFRSQLLNWDICTVLHRYNHSVNSGGNCSTPAEAILAGHLLDVTDQREISTT
ncbi:hypothetical protein B566_EDAN016866, partial [Ephemera danica]